MDPEEVMRWFRALVPTDIRNDYAGLLGERAQQLMGGEMRSFPIKPPPDIESMLEWFAGPGRAPTTGAAPLPQFTTDALENLVHRVSTSGMKVGPGISPSPMMQFDPILEKIRQIGRGYDVNANTTLPGFDLISGALMTGVMQNPELRMLLGLDSVQG
jgi:hypothetical protein